MDIAEPGVPAALQGLLRVARLARTADVPCLLKTTAEVLSEIRNGREHVRWGAGAAGYVGSSFPLSDTMCARLLDGRINNVVSDTTLEESLNQLAGVKDGAVRAYIGVPFETDDARAYVLCCLAGEARPDLREADVRFLQGIAESLRPFLGA